MAKMRIVANNIADYCLVATSSTAGEHAAPNLLTDDKSTVARSVGTSLTITGTSTALLSASCAHLPFCNLSPTAIWQWRFTTEDAATNILTYSEDFGNSVWTRASAGTGVVPGAVGNNEVAPDGTLTAETFTFNAGAGVGAGDFSLVTHVADFAVTAGVKYSSSIFFKGAAGQQLVFRGVAGSAFTKVTLDGNWQRIQTSEIAGTPNFEFGIRQGVAGTINSAVTVAVWGAQLERNDTATSYIKTLDASASRPRGYIDDWQPYAYGSGVVLAAPAPARAPRGWTPAQAASAYANGGGAQASIYFPPLTFTGFRVDILDAANAQGYIEAARLIVGSYWEPENAPSAAPLTIIDSTELYYNAAGGQMARAGNKRRRVGIDLQFMGAEDRARLVGVLIDSRSYPILISVFPDNPDAALESDYSVYGRMPEDATISVMYAAAYETKVQVEEI